MKKTVKPNLNEIRNNINNYYLKKLTKPEINWDILKNIQFHKIKYKNILEILSQEDKSFEEKYREYIEIEYLYNWLVEIRVDTKEKIEFFLDTPEFLEYLYLKEENENLSLDDFPNLKNKLETFNKKQEKKKEKYYKWILEIEKKLYLWDYQIVTCL